MRFRPAWRPPSQPPPCLSEFARAVWSASEDPKRSKFRCLHALPRSDSEVALAKQYGPPQRVRTTDLLLRRPALCPAELMAQWDEVYRICGWCEVSRTPRQVSRQDQ